MHHINPWDDLPCLIWVIMKWILLSSNQSINSLGIHRLLPISFGHIYPIFIVTFSLNLSGKELNAVWNFSSCGDLSPPWTTLIRMKSDLLAGLRFIDSIKSFVLTSESCSGFIGSIFDMGVVERSKKIYWLWNVFLKKWPLTGGQIIWAGVRVCWLINCLFVIAISVEELIPL